MNRLQHLIVVLSAFIIASTYSSAEKPGRQQAVQNAEVAEKDPHEGSIEADEDSPRLQSKPEAPVKWVCPGPLNQVTQKSPDIGEPHLRTNPDCLAAFYDFSNFNSEKGIVQDKSGNGFDLAVVNRPATVTDGISGAGVNLAGGYFQAKGNPLAGADHFTISLWFKTAEPMTNYKLLSAAVWSGGNNASGWNIGTHYSEFWSDNQEGSLRGEPGWERGAEFRKGEWNHLVVTYDGANAREYINGQQSVAIRGTGLRVGNGAPLVVGAWMGGFQFHGDMDEVRIYRRALKLEEVQSLFRDLAQARSGISHVDEKKRVNELGKIFGDPSEKISAAAKESASKYYYSLVSEFSKLPEAADTDELLSPTERFKKNYESNHRPIIEHLKNGNASEKRVYDASQAVYESLLYVAVDLGNSAWPDEGKNALLRITHKPPGMEELSNGIGLLLLDFLQMANPEEFKKFIDSQKDRLQEAGAPKPAPATH